VREPAASRLDATEGEIAMASIHREIVIDAAGEAVWDAVRDVGALHTRLVPGFVVDTQLEADVRVVTFANGLQAREQIVALDDATRRLVWSVVGGRPTHHNGALQIVAEGPQRCRAVWIADLLPHDLAPAIDAMMQQGLQAMKRAMERP
jgi:hypothetical protein